MKRFIKNLSKSMLITACAIGLPVITANAQFSGNDITYPEGYRFISAAGYDGLNNPVDSATFTWSLKGFPIPVEMYGWDEYGVKSLVNTGKIISDTGDLLSYEMTTLGGDTVLMVVQQEATFNAFGEPLEMTTTIEGAPTPFIKVDFQYWHKANNQLDSVLVTTNNLMGLGSSWVKRFYTAYDASGRPTIIESIDWQGVYQKELYTYSATQHVVETYENSEATGGVLTLIEKMVSTLDAKGRNARVDNYSYDAYNLIWTLDSYTIYHYDDSQMGIPRAINAGQVIVSLTGGELLINTPAAETVEIYSVSGELLYAAQKTAGEYSIPVANLSTGVYIIKGDSGWTKKIVK